MTKTIKVGDTIKVLSPLGIIEDGFTIHQDDRTKSGSVIVENKEGEFIKIHPDRIIDQTDGDSVIVYEHNEAVAPCPQCGKLIKISSDQTELNCPEHGVFKAHISDKIKTTSKMKAASQSNKSATKFVNLDSLSKIGELWVKDDVNFDHDHVEVMTCCIIFEKQSRYITFNIYNGSYGRKNKKPPFDEVLDGKDVGYNIKDISTLRNKYIAKGYKKYKSNKA
jgi:hypothetical protein